MSTTTFANRAEVRELASYCLPALLAALILRVVITWQLPYGHCYIDTPDFLLTPEQVLFHHHWVLHGKKTFLAPLCFTIPFLLHLPALVFVPLFQHGLGVLLVALTGLLCRCWFARWRWWTIPITLAVALDPALLWFEQTLMAETLFVFCTVLLATAGTLYTLRPTRSRFAFLCLALVLEAGARPEGKLFLGFGLLLVVLLHAPQWRRNYARLLILLTLTIGVHLITKTSQAGLLLYTSVARFTPADLRVAPDFEPYVAPIRTDLERRWRDGPLFPRVSDRRLIDAAVAQYLKDKRGAAAASDHRMVSDFCLRVAAETCRRRWLQLPGYAWAKFRATASESPAGAFDHEWLIEHQHRAYADETERMLRLSHGLSGRVMHANKDWRTFVDTHFHEVPWFNRWQERWFAALSVWRLPDRKCIIHRGAGSFPWIVPGVPLYFLLAAVGAACALLRDDRLRAFHWAWALTLAGVFFVIMLTANVKPRFRVVFEPFWWIYIGFLFDSLVLATTSVLRQLNRARPVDAPSI